MICPVCKSEKNETFDASYLSKDVEQKLAPYYTRSGTFKFPICKCLCLDCGAVFEYMSEDVLKEFNENMKYFK